MKKRRRRWGDRSDGRLLRTLDPFMKMVPYIMKDRVDAQNYFEETIDITEVDKFLREKRKENGNINIGFLHIVIAAMVRTISQKPAINRFVAGQKIYARNGIYISLAIKKRLSESSAETTIKVKFDPESTIEDIAEKLNKEILANKDEDTSNNTDKTADLFMKAPGFLVRFLVWFIKRLDYMGIMPRILNEVSPFHTSVFITDLGSLGIEPVYHHLYEFGTTTAFIAFGRKRRKKVIDRNDNIITKRYVSIKVVTDERIADGYYFASAFKLYTSLLSNPQQLDKPPEKVFEDID